MKTLAILLNTPYDIALDDAAVRSDWTMALLEGVKAEVTSTILAHPIYDDTHQYQALSLLYPEDNAITALSRYLSDTPYELVLLLSPDMPLVDAQLVKTLFNTYEDEDTIVCFRQHGTPYIEPFPGLYHRDTIHLMATDLLAGKTDLQGLLTHTGSHKIEIPRDARLLKATNPVDLSRIRELMGT